MQEEIQQRTQRKDSATAFEEKRPKPDITPY
jgi:hypothetical protein